MRMQIKCMAYLRNISSSVGLITSGCSTAIENLYIFVEKCLYSEVLNNESSVKYLCEMVMINDNLNKSDTLGSDCKLASFDIINMVPSINNISGLRAVKDRNLPTVVLFMPLNYT